MKRSLFFTALAALPALPALAASTAGAQQPAIRPLGAIVARSTQPWGNIVSVRQLSNGGVFVNDLTGRKVVLLDSTLATATVVADTTSATANAYSGRFGGLIAYRGDSTLFVDPTSMSMLVLDPAGKIARVMSVPRSQDAGALASIIGGSPGFDASGRLVYRGRPQFIMPPRPANGGVPPMPTQPDSSPILRVDLATRQLDTVGLIKIPKVTMNVVQDNNGRVTMTSEINPLPVIDEWAVLSNGSVALVRGRDYHVDFVNADGSRTSASKVPFEWQRLTDEDKVAFIDSVKAARERMAANGSGSGLAEQQVVRSSGQAGRGADGGAEQRVQVMIGGLAGSGPPPGGAGSMPMPQLNFVSPSELPDYKPPFLANSVRADADGNIWIRTIPTRAIPGGPVYDVINGKGELTDRVQLPAGRQVIGFGPGGVVYLTSRDSAGFVLERARAR